MYIEAGRPHKQVFFTFFSYATHLEFQIYDSHEMDFRFRDTVKSPQVFGKCRKRVISGHCRQKVNSNEIKGKQRKFPFAKREGLGEGGEAKHQSICLGAVNDNGRLGIYHGGPKAPLKVLPKVCTCKMVGGGGALEETYLDFDFIWRNKVLNEIENVVSEKHFFLRNLYSATSG